MGAPIKVVIAGGRDLTDYGMIVEAVHSSGLEISEVVSGACGLDADDPHGDEKPAKGADHLGEMWAKAHDVPVKRFYAAWKRLGRMAGPIRNGEMATYANALIALPGNRGTADMVQKAVAHGLVVFGLDGKTVLPLLPKQREILGSEKPITFRGGYGNRYYNEAGDRVLHAVSLREAERYKHGMEERGFDARIERDPLRVVATKKV